MSNQRHCRSCRHLDFNTMSDEMYCKLKDYEPIRLRWHKHRPEWCPRLEKNRRVKDERIDGDALKDRLQSLAYDDWNQGVTTSLVDAYRKCADMVEEQPTITPERKRGRWHGRIYSRDETMVCSECHAEFSYDAETDIRDFNYCPNCGADMREDES